MCQVKYMTLLFSHMCVCEFHFVSSFFQKFSHDLSVSHCVSSFGNSIFFVLLNIALVPILAFALKLIVNQAYIWHMFEDFDEHLNLFIWQGINFFEDLLSQCNDSTHPKKRILKLAAKKMPNFNVKPIRRKPHSFYS